MRGGLLLVMLILLIGVFTVVTVESTGKTLPFKYVSEETCYGCHGQIRELKSEGPHKEINCAHCHTGLNKHLTNVKVRPKTLLDLSVCGSCHTYEYETFAKTNLNSIARFDKGDPKSRSPYWETLIAPYLFALEHNEPRSHKYMLVDHLVVDRAYNGKFKFKDWRTGLIYKAGIPKAWDVLYDAYPGQPVKPKKPFLAETGWAGNSVCLLCKSTDDILDWPYMGDPKAGAPLSRTTPAYKKALEFLNNPMGCIHCHDPHAARHRIVRDGLIQALSERNDTLWHEGYPGKANIKVVTMGLRGYERKIALLDKADPMLQCGQCHVEYTCNPVIENVEPGDPKKGKKGGMASPLSNHFPFIPLAKVEGDKIVEETAWNHINKYKYRDFRHFVTKAGIWKLQHPEVEVFWRSEHNLAGVTCTDCHTYGTTTKDGKKLYSHWHASPRDLEWKPCLKCHTEWTAEEAEYVADSIRNYIKQKMRKAEVWGRFFIDRFQDALDAGVSEDILKQARIYHEKAHIYWEWWTAENSDGFHNPQLARVTLGESIRYFKKGISLLDKAIREKK